MTQQIIIGYKDFDGQEKSARAEVRWNDASAELPGSVYVVGSMGYGKARMNLGEAVSAYLGGREYMSFALVC